RADRSAIIARAPVRRLRRTPVRRGGRVRLMATVLKTVIGASLSRVQIPAPPPNRLRPAATCSGRSVNIAGVLATTWRLSPRFRNRDDARVAKHDRVATGCTEVLKDPELDQGRVILDHPRRIGEI